MGGYCPIEIEGTIDGVPFVLRDENETLALTVGSAPAWRCVEPLSEDRHGGHSRGFVHNDEAAAFLARAVGRFRAWRDASADGSPIVR